MGVHKRCTKSAVLKDNQLAVPNSKSSQRRLAKVANTARSTQQLL
jgi:hypothetical protein